MITKEEIGSPLNPVYLALNFSAPHHSKSTRFFFFLNTITLLQLFDSELPTSVSALKAEMKGMLRYMQTALPRKPLLPQTLLTQALKIPLACSSKCKKKMNTRVRPQRRQLKTPISAARERTHDLPLALVST